MDKEHLTNHLQKMREYHTNLLEKYEKEAKPIIQHYASITSAFDDAQYWARTLEFGRMHAKMIIDQCDKLLKTIPKEKPRGLTKRR
jgi:PadR family transcriptional regulator AphA